jgi:hypothetical protein
MRRVFTCLIPAGPKFDPERHLLLRKTAAKQEPDKAVAFSTGDIVEAQWTGLPGRRLLLSLDRIQEFWWTGLS